MEIEKKEIITKLFSINEEEVIQALSYIEQKKTNEYTSYLLKLLDKTDNQKIKGLIALIFYDLKDPRTLTEILKEIKKESNKNNRGKLIFACQAFDCSKYIDIFIELLVDSNFTVSMSSGHVIEYMNGPFEKTKLKNIINSLKQKRNDVDDPTKGNINDVIRHLNKLLKKQE